MTEKETLIASAALRVFKRIGVRRATMNDIAQEAGVVRQTLYNLFANKDEVVHGAVLHYLEGQRRQTLQGWQGVSTLGEKLDVVFQNYVVTPWHDVQNTPETEEIEASTNAVSRQAFDTASERLKAMLADLFAPYRHVLAGLGNSPDGLAEFAESAMRGIKHGATDADQITRNLASLKTSLLMMTGECEVAAAHGTTAG